MTAHPIRVQHVFERGLWVRVRVRVRVGVGVALPPNQRGTDQVREMTRRVILARDHEVTVAIDVDRHEALGLASRRLGGRRCVRLALAPLARPNRLRLRLLRMVRVRVRVIRVRVRVRVRPNPNPNLRRVFRVEFALAVPLVLEKLADVPPLGGPLGAPAVRIAARVVAVVPGQGWTRVRAMISVSVRVGVED